MMQCPWIPYPLAVAALLGLLLALPDAVTAASPPHPGAEEIQRQVTEVLARPEFSPQVKVPWYYRLVEEFFKWLGSLPAAAPGLYWVLLAGCVVLLLALLAHIAWTIKRILFVGAGPDAAAADRSKREHLSRMYREEARRRAEQGDFTEAIRYLFLALVYRFDETGRVLFQPALTNREYLALFADRPHLGEQLRVFVDTLDDHWYGQRPAGQARYEECLGLSEDLERTAM
jgi:hypothetical protein